MLACLVLRFGSLSCKQISNYVLNNTFRKIFAIKSFDIATDCVLDFGCAVQDTLWRRKSKFLTKLKYKTAVSSCAKVASDELAELLKLMR